MGSRTGIPSNHSAPHAIAIIAMGKETQSHLSMLRKAVPARRYGGDASEPRPKGEWLDASAPGYDSLPSSIIDVQSSP